MSAAHTPGPWSVYSNARKLGLTEFYGIDGANDKAVVLWDKCGGITSEANARLIAAAPELLELLKEINDALYCDDFGHWCLPNNFDARQLDEVIGKATGDAA